jgi:tagatose 6-phosphate kinase
MITTVTLNAALDITYSIPHFKIDQLHRITDYLSVPGGKGVNVARVLHTLDEDVITTGFVAGYQGAALLAGLRNEGIQSDFIHLQNGETRRAITILDHNQGTSTELVEEGPSITETEIQSLRQKVESLAKVSKWILFCGSLPIGCPSWMYAELTEIAHQQGAKVGLDARGEALREGLHGKPDLVKPNEHELADLVGIHPDDDDATIQAISSLIGNDRRLMVVSQGERGALAGYAGKFYRIHIPKVKAINPVGSGDSMMAGLVISLCRESDIFDILKLGAACGTANTLHKMAGKVSLQDINRIQRDIRITSI